MSVEQLIPVFDQFMDQSGKLLDIQNEVDYAEAMKALDELFEMAADQENDPYGRLIDMIASSIHEYEKMMKVWRSSLLRLKVCL
jgi:antitoxin component HigA of HigAB toxin-antitoxin module